MGAVQTLTVAEDDAGQRLDRWLRRRFPHLAQGAIEKLCRTGQLRLDGARAKASDRVAAGQAVRVPPLPEAPPPGAAAAAAPRPAPPPPP
ncbi:MAG: RluA family pseudouridine synthase, partial [Gemmobacter sp.]